MKYYINKNWFKDNGFSKKYIEEKSLAKILSEITQDNWIGKVMVPNTKKSWDMGYNNNGQTQVIEYDGPYHYQKPLKIKMDNEKDEIAKQNNYNVIKFPYWIQLDTNTLKYYFNLEAEITTDFPHGFITTEHFPASFCPKGIERFEKELSDLPENIKKDVLISLRNKAEKYGKEYVVPESMFSLL
jgi:hypothetical protein|tara:strand:+ start:114 stop:668 length:555 start_codon:yes stop_codon:yes gene_type:complete